MEDFKKYLILDKADSLCLNREINRLNLGQEEVKEYQVVNGGGVITGLVRVVEHTSIKKPFRTTFRIIQADLSGKVLLDKLIGD